MAECKKGKGGQNRLFSKRVNKKAISGKDLYHIKKGFYNEKIIV